MIDTDPDPGTGISIRSGDTEVELAGTRGFVEEFLGVLRAFGSIPGEVPRAGGDQSGAEEDEPSRSVDAFLERLGISPGSTPVAELIVVFGYYVTRVQRRPSFTVEDLEFHFAHAGTRGPRNLANTLGGLKRKRGFIDRGEARGTYVLTSSGVRHIESMQRAAR